MNKKPVFDYPLFALGFRTFFILAGLSALLLITLWTSLYDGSLKTDNYFPVNFWHAHEMLLGYTVAVIAGFLLTAVSNWTGLKTVDRGKLFALGLLWLYGRIASFFSESIADELIALIDFAFLPALAYTISQPIIKAGNYQNLIFTVLLLTMAVGNGLVHAEMLAITDNTAWQGLNIVAAIIIVMILVIAGRVFPFFTESGLRSVIAIRNPKLDLLSIIATAIVFVLLIADIQGFLMAIAAISALALNTARAFGWYDRKIWYVPLLWVLYVGYSWIMLGFGLLAIAAFSVIPLSIALHAFTVGGIGVISLGMMARVSLGHTGRAMKASNVMALAFVLINLAALFRVLLPTFLPGWYDNFILISSYFWLAAFSLFVYYYSPILSAPRIDGKKG